MKGRYRKIACFLCVILVVTSLSACGNKSNVNESTGNVTTESETHYIEPVNPFEDDCER